MLKQILVGVVIGVANIIPGVSGGTMAVSMGIYDKLIHAVTHIFKEFKQGLKLLIPVVIGAGLGIVGLSFIITDILFKYLPVQTNFLFIGLIIGGLPIILKRYKGASKKVSVGNAVVMVAFFLLVVGMAAIGEAEGRVADVSFSLANVLKLFGVGLVASATMIIPGVSGSMVMMIMGYYSTILETITLFIKSALSFDIPGLITTCEVLVPFGLGVLLGIGVIAKLIEMLFEKAPAYAYSAIIGLIVASPFAIILMSDLSQYTFVAVLTGLVACALGFFIASKLGEE